MLQNATRLICAEEDCFSIFSIVLAYSVSYYSYSPVKRANAVFIVSVL